MPVIHHELPVMVTITAWCPTCRRETKQTVECVDGGVAATRWCHRCLLPRTQAVPPRHQKDGDTRGLF